MYVGPVERDEPNVLLRVDRLRGFGALNMPGVPWPPRLDEDDRRSVGGIDTGPEGVSSTA